MPCTAILRIDGTAALHHGPPVTSRNSTAHSASTSPSCHKTARLLDVQVPGSSPHCKYGLTTNGPVAFSIVGGRAFAISSAGFWQPKLERASHKVSIDHVSRIVQVLPSGFIMASSLSLIESWLSTRKQLLSWPLGRLREETRQRSMRLRGLSAVGSAASTRGAETARARSNAGWDGDFSPRPGA